MRGQTHVVTEPKPSVVGRPGTTTGRQTRGCKGPSSTTPLRFRGPGRSMWDLPRAGASSGKQSSAVGKERSVLRAEQSLRHPCTDPPRPRSREHARPLAAAPRTGPRGLHAGGTGRLPLSHRPGAVGKTRWPAGRVLWGLSPGRVVARPAGE